MNDIFFYGKVITVVGFVLALIGFFFPIGALKNKTKEYRQNLFGALLIMLSFNHLMMWKPTPTTTGEGLVQLCGLLLVIASLAFMGLKKTKPLLTKLAFLMLVVYVFLLII